MLSIADLDQRAVPRIPASKFPTPKRFGTWISALALLVVGAVVFLAVALGDPLELLAQPTESGQRFVDRRVLVDQAIARADSDLRRRVRLVDPRAGKLQPAEAAELLVEIRRFDGPSPDLLGCTAVLYALDGNLDATRRIVEGLEFSAPELAAAIAAGWLDGPTPPDGTDPWQGTVGTTCRRRLAEAIAVRAEDAAEAEAQAAAIRSRGDALLDRVLRLATIRSGVIAVGLAVFLGWMAFGRRGTRVAQALVEDAWPPALGTAVLVRGGFWAVVITLLVFGLTAAIGTPVLGLTMPALAAALPLVTLTVQRLLWPQRCGLLKAFGLLPDIDGLMRAVLWTLPVFAFQQLGTLAIEHSGHALGFARHWSEGFAEDFLFAPQKVALAAAVNFVLWVPLSEEFAFRGVMYGTLRNRVSPVAATLVSAAAFAMFHLAMTAFAPFVLCTAVGLATAFWNGLVWTVAYERTRSLLPGFLAHAAANAFSVAGTHTLFG